MSYSDLRPRPGDTENVLLAKILQALNSGSGGGGSGSGSLLNFTDENSNADAVIWVNSGATEIARFVGSSMVLTMATPRIQRDVTDSQIAIVGATGKSTGAYIAFNGDDHPTDAGDAEMIFKGTGEFRIGRAAFGSILNTTKFSINNTDAQLAVPLSFSGTDHAGLRLNNLTTAQRTALTGAEGDLVMDTDLDYPLFYDGSSWVHLGLVDFVLAASDETTALTSGSGKLTFRMPFAMTVTSVKASLTTTSSSGNVVVDINEAGSSILSTEITVEAGDTTSLDAATQPVISDSALAADAEITVDIDNEGTGAAGLKVTISGYRA